MRAQGSEGWSDADKILEGAMQCLRNLVVPQTSLDEVRKTNTTPEFPLWVRSGSEPAGLVIPLSANSSLD